MHAHCGPKNLHGFPLGCITVYHFGECAGPLFGLCSIHPDLHRGGGNSQLPPLDLQELKRSSRCTWGLIVHIPEVEYPRSESLIVERHEPG